MASVNKAILVGNLGRDPEMRSTQDGRAIASLAVATSESWKDKATGDKKERTEWHRVSVFGQPAEYIGRYAKKGDMVWIEGQIQTRKWTDKEGIHDGDYRSGVQQHSEYPVVSRGGFASAVVWRGA